MKILSSHLPEALALRILTILFFLSLLGGTFLSKNLIIKHQKNIYLAGIVIITIVISILSAWSRGAYFMGIIQVELGVITFLTMTRPRAISIILAINVSHILITMAVFPDTAEFSKQLSFFGPPQLIFALISMVAHHIIFTYRIRDFIDNKNLSSLNKTLKKEIEERKAAEAASSQAQKKLVTLNLTKDKMFSIIAHDLRGPLGNIKSVVKLFLDEHEEMDSASLREFFKALYQDTENTFLLLENLLLWARSQKGDIQPEPTETDISSLIHETIEILKGVREKKNISIQTDIPENLTAVIDSSMIMTVLRNLVGNAIKFTPGGGEISIAADKTSNELIISIKDTGTGMSEEVIKKILNSDEFYSTYGTDNEKGSGLGIKLCRQFIEAHQGMISITSSKGSGSTFTVRLPL